MVTKGKMGASPHPTLPFLSSTLIATFPIFVDSVKGATGGTSSGLPSTLLTSTGKVSFRLSNPKQILGSGGMHYSVDRGFRFTPMDLCCFLVLAFDVFGMLMGRFHRDPGDFVFDPVLPPVRIGCGSLGGELGFECRSSTEEEESSSLMSDEEFLSIDCSLAMEAESYHIFKILPNLRVRIVSHPCFRIVLVLHSGMGSFSYLVCQIPNAVKLQDATPLFSTSSPRPSLPRFCLLSPLPRRCFRCSASAGPVVVVCEDEKYGKKEVISLTPELYKYVLSNVREPEILREVREETARMRGSQMQVSPEQAQFLSMLVQILGAKRCIEIGIYTGYSSLSIALALPKSGILVACEKDKRCIEIAQKYYERAGVSDKVSVKQGPAVDSLKSMIQNGESCSYDFAFIDADKRMYSDYFELLLQLENSQPLYSGARALEYRVRVGGIIIVDNVLWHGRVIDPLINDRTTVSIRNFNKKILEDKRINISMVPIGDGITICRKIVT